MTFDRMDIIAFLRAVDARLTRPGTIRLIGGAVISIAYVPSYETRDVDYVYADQEVDKAVADVAAAQPELVGGVRTGTYLAPYTYEDRLEDLQVPGLGFLHVLIPERHDLAITKIARGYTRDIDAVAAMHRCEPFDLPTLVERYQETWVTGPQGSADIGFRSALSGVFGDEDAGAGMELLADLRRRGARPEGRRPRHK